MALNSSLMMRSSMSCLPILRLNFGCTMRGVVCLVSRGGCRSALCCKVRELGVLLKDLALDLLRVNSLCLPEVKGLKHLRLSLERSLRCGNARFKAGLRSCAEPAVGGLLVLVLLLVELGQRGCTGPRGLLLILTVLGVLIFFSLSSKRGEAVVVEEAGHWWRSPSRRLAMLPWDTLPLPLLCSTGWR